MGKDKTYIKQLEKIGGVIMEDGRITIKKEEHIKRLKRVNLNEIRSYGWNWAFKSKRVIFTGPTDTQNDVAKIVMKKLL